MGLPYDYMPKILQALDLISQGYTETRACDWAAVSVSTFKHYIKESAELQAMLEEASQRGYDAMAEALLAPDNHALYGHSDAKMAKVQSDNIKWFLEKKKPKEYGQKVEINHHLTADKAITQALNFAKQRVLPSPQYDVIDVVPVEQTEAEMMAEIFAP